MKNHIPKYATNFPMHSSLSFLRPLMKWVNSCGEHPILLATWVFFIPNCLISLSTCSIVSLLGGIDFIFKGKDVYIILYYQIIVINKFLNTAGNSSLSPAMEYFRLWHFVYAPNLLAKNYCSGDGVDVVFVLFGGIHYRHHYPIIFVPEGFPGYLDFSYCGESLCYICL